MVNAVLRISNGHSDMVYASDDMVYASGDMVYTRPVI
jgi:hypothetical protein